MESKEEYTPFEVIELPIRDGNRLMVLTQL